MNTILKEYENIALSDTNLLNLVSKKANIILYPSLINYKTIEDVIGPHKATFLLFEAKKHYGHWCLIFQQNEHIIEFFNPYGGYPDDSLEYIDMEYREKSNQVHTYLSKLLFNSRYQLTYNEFDFQKHNPNIKTCGRWCVVRLLLRNLDLYQFKKYIDNMKKDLNLDGDKLVTLLTMYINNKK